MSTVANDIVAVYQLVLDASQRQRAAVIGLCGDVAAARVTRARQRLHQLEHFGRMTARTENNHCAQRRRRRRRRPGHDIVDERRKGGSAWRRLTSSIAQEVCKVGVDAGGEPLHVGAEHVAVVAQSLGQFRLVVVHERVVDDDDERLGETQRLEHSACTSVANDERCTVHVARQRRLVSIAVALPSRRRRTAERRRRRRSAVAHFDAQLRHVSAAAVLQAQRRVAGASQRRVKRLSVTNANQRIKLGRTDLTSE